MRRTISANMQLKTGWFKTPPTAIMAALYEQMTDGQVKGHIWSASHVWLVVFLFVQKYGDCS